MEHGTKLRYRAFCYVFHVMCYVIINLSQNLTFV